MTDIRVDEIEVSIASYFNYRQNIIVPKCYGVSWDSHECDVLILKPSGYVIEVEIKRTFADFKADFKKLHHHKHKHIKEFYYCFTNDIYDKCKDLVPLGMGIIICSRQGNYISSIIKKVAIPIKGAVKLSTEEQLKIAKLGCMRIWTLKQKLNLKNNLHLLNK
jgi:hypothetical protein